MKTKQFIFLLIISFILTIYGCEISETSTESKKEFTINLLRGQYDALITDFLGTDRNLIININDLPQIPDETGMYFVGGCLEMGEISSPMAVQISAQGVGVDTFDIVIIGTAVVDEDLFTIKFIGDILVSLDDTSNDEVIGTWTTGPEQGSWIADHVDTSKSNCSGIILEEQQEFYFDADLYAGIQVFDDGTSWSNTLLGASSNIVSTAVEIILPDGNSILMPYSQNIFNAEVDFITDFHFGTSVDGFPIINGMYKFTLLDPNGNPIVGATTADSWSGCPIDAPRNVKAIISDKGIEVTWDPVSPVPAFYQIELYAPGSEMTFGAADIHQTSHLIPFEEVPGPGYPDGDNYGYGLSDLPNNEYSIDVIAFAEAPSEGPGIGMECQVRAFEETVLFEKSGETVNILP